MVLFTIWKGVPSDQLLLEVQQNLKAEVLNHCNNYTCGGHLGCDKT